MDCMTEDECEDMGIQHEPHLGCEGSPCPDCGYFDTIDLYRDDMVVTVCAGCGSDE